MLTSGQQVKRRWGGSRSYGSGMPWACSNFNSTRTPRPPVPPQSYALPGTYTRVTTAAELLTALSANPTNIVLADGSYDHAGPGFVTNNSNLYAEHLGMAVLTCGLGIIPSGGTAPIVRGLTINVSDITKGFDAGGGVRACIGTSETNLSTNGISILDCVVDGNNVLQYGVFAYGSPNLKLQRLIVRNLRDSSGVKEVQTLTVNATGGTFTITYPSGTPQTTAPLNWNSTAAQVQAALQALSNVGSALTGAGTPVVSCAGGPCSTAPVTITFNDYAPDPLCTTTATSLTGGSHSATIVETTLGVIPSGYPVGLRLASIFSTIGPYSFDTISDLDISNVSAFWPGRSGGTEEAGLFLGVPVINGVTRIRCRQVSQSSIETIQDCASTVFSDLDIDMSGPNQPAFPWTVGVYQEHYSVGLTFQRFLFKACHTAFTAEWDNGQITPITTLTTGFTQPAVGGSTTIAIADTSWWIGREWVGMRIVGAGFYTTSIVDGTHMLISNYGFPNSTAPGGTVLAAANISPGIAGAHFNIFIDGTIIATGSNGSGSCGIYGDQGTQGMTIQRVAFIGHTFAAVAAYNNLDAPTISSNSYSSVGAQFSTSHI